MRADRQFLRHETCIMPDVRRPAGMIAMELLEKSRSEANWWQNFDWYLKSLRALAGHECGLALAHIINCVPLRSTTAMVQERARKAMARLQTGKASSLTRSSACRISVWGPLDPVVIVNSCRTKHADHFRESQLSIRFRDLLPLRACLRPATASAGPRGGELSRPVRGRGEAYESTQPRSFSLPTTG
ncbi:hypothetical protein BP6252_12143 [Coleophoma cylindrospora]|uniref:Uncharacterized protein n=1 Tax=Coleophoma cylindrospora TaxID=1849047 RepID=A0A3D8QGF6_9HELO|nr:hypothetical protein BP6252_12143 [Coleophoma cylindrospora]